MLLTKSMFYYELHGIIWHSDASGEVLTVGGSGLLCSYNKEKGTASYPVDDNQIETVPCPDYQYFLNTVVANVFGPPFSVSMIHTWTFEQVGWYLVDRIKFNLVSDADGDIHVIGAKGRTLLIYNPSGNKIADCVTGKVYEQASEQAFYKYVMLMLDQMLQAMTKIKSGV